MNKTIVAQLFQQGRRFSYERDDIIIRAGDVPSGVYYITDGWVKAYSLCPDGEQIIMMTLYPGDMFPLAWATNGDLRDINFAALDTTKLWRLSRDDFLTLIQTRSAFSHSVLCALAQNFFTLTTEINNLHYRTAREKVVFRLLRLAMHFGEYNGDEIIITKRISNEYIARSTNMARETASREIGRLHRKRLIHQSNGYITIPSLEHLKNEIGSYFDLTAL